MPLAVKIAVTVPAQLYKAMESARKRQARSRSAIVQEALRQWLRQQVHAALVHEYEQGYRRKPETKREIDAAMATAISLLDGESDW
jgi:metal-responsive CopG/Arc/MetJ family transcriptional regulator